jgi:hypothetical protein
VLVGGVVLGMGATAAAPQANRTCDPKWHVEQKRAGVFFNGIAAFAANDVWVVGSERNRPLIEHWDGRAWERIAGAVPRGRLEDVAGSAATDVWAVGSRLGIGGRRVPEVEHWDGGEWKATPAPSVRVGLRAVSAASPTEAWVLGKGNRLARWDGTSWRVTPIRGLGPGDLLTDVSADSSGDVWSVGQTGGILTDYSAIAARWDGHRWRLTSPRFRGNSGSETGLYDAVSLDGGDVWALGDSAPLYSGSYHQLVERWDGAGWQQVAAPKDPKGLLDGLAITGTSSSDIWIAGDRGYPGYPSFEHWSGGRWKVWVGRGVSLRGSFLGAVSEVTDADVWAAGGGLSDEHVPGYLVHLTCSKSLA